jgi:hypothetical protein
MKKVLLVLAAVVLVASGVAAVSAYEAHVINVRAHVENALEVNLGTPYELDFGTVFPEEWLTKEFVVGTSDSFCDTNQWRMTAVNYTVWVEWKTLSDNGTPGDPSDDTYYGWLGDALYIGIVDPPYTPAMEKPEGAGGDLVWVGNVTPPGPPGALKVWDSPEPIYKAKSGPQNQTDRIVVGLDVPVFEGFYNPLTDALACPDGKPSGLDEPTVVIAEDDPRWDPDGVDLGVDLKIQVTNIWKK